MARGSLSQLGRSRYSAGRREVRPQHLPSRADQHVLEGGLGPRVQSRINNDDGQVAARLQELELQWGRVLMNAETSRVSVFTGGLMVLASMGPRSHERGNSFLPAAKSGMLCPSRFNGAAFS